MAKLQDIINSAIGTGIAGYTVAATWQALTEQTLVQALKDQENIYVACVAASAAALYSTVDTIFSAAQKYSG